MIPGKVTTRNFVVFAFGYHFVDCLVDLGSTYHQHLGSFGDGSLVLKVLLTDWESP